MFMAELYYRGSEEREPTYTLLYQDQQYQSIVALESINFSSKGNTFNDLYKNLKSVFSEENRNNKDYKVQFKLGQSHVTVSNYIVMKKPSAFISPPNGYFGLFEKQVD